MYLITVVFETSASKRLTQAVITVNFPINQPVKEEHSDRNGSQSHIRTPSTEWTQIWRFFRCF